MKTAFLVDSCANLTPDMRAHPDVFIAYLTANFKDGHSLKDTNDPETYAEFKRLRSINPLPPHSAQPGINLFYDIFDEIVSLGYERVIGFMMSDKLSGTYGTSRMVAADYEDKLDLHIYDSQQMTGVIQMTLEEAIRLVEQGASMEEIDAHCTRLLRTGQYCFVVDQMKTITDGGRVSGGQADLRLDMCQKAAFEIDANGAFAPIGRYRTRKRVDRKMLEIVEEKYREYKGVMSCIITHVFCPERAEQLKQSILELLPDVHVRIDELAVAFLLHVGDNGYVMSLVNKETSDQ